jgi:hypothetical protein
MSALLPVAMAAFADGVQIGQGKSSPVRKFKFFKKVDGLFEDESFRTDSEIFAVSIGAEYSAMERIEHYLRYCASWIAGASGFGTMDQETFDKMNDGSPGSTMSRVWDVWLIAAQSVTAGLYAAGVKVGEEWAESDQLAGILAATEEAE